MPSTIDCIAKDGIIDHFDDNRIYVRILSLSACGSCQAKGLCMTSESVEKIIEVDRKGADEIRQGQLVRVSMKAANGNLAVVFGYVIPFSILILSVLILVNFVSEGIAGLVSVLLLLPYYAGLYLLRKRIEQKFRFTIE